MILLIADLWSVSVRRNMPADPDLPRFPKPEHVIGFYRRRPPDEEVSTDVPLRQAFEPLQRGQIRSPAHLLWKEELHLRHERFFGFCTRWSAIGVAVICIFVMISPKCIQAGELRYFPRIVEVDDRVQGRKRHNGR
jgi:hypothetical protein